MRENTALMSICFHVVLLLLLLASSVVLFPFPFPSSDEGLRLSQRLPASRW